jgi:uncharacterized protein YjiK
MRYLKINILAILLLALPAAARSIAELLGKYDIALQKEIDTESDSSLSGVAFDPNTGTLLVVDDDAQSMYELTTSGIIINKTELQGFTDIEGIAYQTNRYFLIVEERRGNVIRIELPEIRSSACRSATDAASPVGQSSRGRRARSR